LTGQPPVLQLLGHHLVSPLNVTQAAQPPEAGVVMVNVCCRFHPPQDALQFGIVLSTHEPTQSTIMLAVQAFADVFVHQFVLLHHHVHGPVPLTAVGLPVAQVAVGVVAELNVALQVPLIHAGFAILQAAVEPVHDPLHDHVCDPLHDPVEYPEGVPLVQVFAVPPQTPLALHGALAILQRPEVVQPLIHSQFHVSVVQQLVVLFIDVPVTH
jgi:hypothetical protein